MEEPTRDDSLVAVCRLAESHQAELLRQALEAEGIEAIADGATLVGLFGISSSTPWAIRILVHQRNRAKALEVIREVLQGREHDVQLLTE